MSAYKGDHRSQYDPGSSARLRSMGCTPVSLANGIRCATGGAVDLSGDAVLAKVSVIQETDPAVPGWSLTDARLAANRIPGAPDLAVRRSPWADVVAAHDSGYALLLQGDSDQFLSGCSGAFDGAHCILVHPSESGGHWYVGDPICPDWRTESPSTLRAYAEKLSGTSVRFAVVLQTVPDDGLPPDTSTGGDNVGLTVTDGASFAGTVDIAAGAPYYPLSGAPGGTLPSVTKPAYATGYLPVQNVRAYLIGDEWAMVPDTYCTPHPASGGTTDEAAIRADQRARDRNEAATNLLP